MDYIIILSKYLYLLCFNFIKIRFCSCYCLLLSLVLNIISNTKLIIPAFQNSENINKYHIKGRERERDRERLKK